MNSQSPRTQRARHPIQVVSRRTGLSKDVIRVWEKRYNAVTPVRDQAGRRLYSDNDIQRLSLLQQVTASGRRIGDIASTTDEELQQFLIEEENFQIHSGRPVNAISAGDDHYLQSLIEYIHKMDDQGIYKVLIKASISLPVIIFLEQVVAKALTYMGTAWKEGSLRVAHEHLATTQIKRFLLNMLDSEQPPGPALIVTTPAGQLHEMGGIMAAIIARSEGWKTTYLGSNMPATEIAAAAIQTEAKAVLMSIIAPTDEKKLAVEINILTDALPEGTTLIIGGGASGQYSQRVSNPQVTFCTDLRALSGALEDTQRVAED